MIIKDPTTDHSNSKTESSMTAKIQEAQLGEDAETTEKLNTSSTDEKKSTATSKGKSNKKRRAPRNYGKIMRLSDLPPLENDQFDLNEFDESILEEGTREYRPSKQRIGIRLPYSDTIIIRRNN